MMTDDDMVKLVSEGFKSLNTELGKLSGEASGRLTALERQLHELSIRVGPVLKAFENDLTTRISLLENDVKTLKEEGNNIRNRIWGSIGFAITALIGAVATLVWTAITRDSGN